MTETNRKTNRKTVQIKKALQVEFPKTEVYQYNAVSIRVRIIDDRFKNRSNVEREDLVEPLIKRLPQEVRDDITVLLLLAPDETDRSMMNAEFEHPTRSRL